MNLPLLDVELPREIRAIHQIECSSRCNLTCIYCPSRDIAAGRYPDRPAMDMTRATFLRALEWVRTFVRAGTQRELNLAGIGESTIHPEFVDFVRLAREAVGWGCHLTFATNGIAVDQAMVDAIKPFKPRVWVSLHRPERAAPAAERLRAAGLLDSMTMDPAVSANDWAGQVAWKKADYRLPCQWLREGKAFVRSDGKITTCCLDASGIGVMGHVDDAIGSVKIAPYGLCKSCYQVIGIKGYDQFGAEEGE